MRISFTYPDSPPLTTLLTAHSAVIAAAIDSMVAPTLLKMEGTLEGATFPSEHSRSTPM